MVVKLYPLFKTRISVLPSSILLCLSGPWTCSWAVAEWVRKENIWIVHTALCILPTAHCTLHTTHCTLHTIHFKLHTENCILHTALYTVHCTLYTANLTVKTTHCSTIVLLIIPVLPWQWGKIIVSFKKLLVVSFRSFFFFQNTWNICIHELAICSSTKIYLNYKYVILLLI